MPYAIRHTRIGFTLIELLVSASIMGLIGLVVLTTFGSGFHVYERIQAYGGVQADALLALEEIEQDLRNTIPSSVIPFEGSETSIRFPAIIETAEEAEGEERAVLAPGQMSYYVESAPGEESVLIQERLGYSRALSGTKAGEGREQVFSTVKDLKFSYYTFDAVEGISSWEESWPPEKEGPPAGVRIEMTFNDGHRDIPLVRTVMIPAVNIVDEIEQEEAEGEGDV